MARFSGTDEFQGAQFVDLTMANAVFREVDLSGARMYGVVLIDADIDGAINGLRVNGVEVAPLIQAELDRREPLRRELRPTDPDGMRRAWEVVESVWEPTMRRARALSEAELNRSVNDEWSFAQTLRHLVFVTDAWFSHAVAGEARPFHPLALPASFSTDGASYGIDTTARPAFDEVARARDDRLGIVRRFLQTVTQEDLDRVREPNPAPGWPPPAARTATECLRVILNEEWTHHQFAIRDLAIIEATRVTGPA